MSRIVSRTSPAGPYSARRACAVLTILLALATSQGADGQTPLQTLVPTAHPPVPAHATAYWLTPAAPSAITPALKDFARAATIIGEGGDALSAGPLLIDPTLDATPLADHVRYYRGLVAQQAGRLDEAQALYTAVAAATARSHVSEQALWRLADVHELRGQFAAAADVYLRLSAAAPAAADLARAHYKRGVALERADDPAASVAAHRLVYYDFPLSAEAEAAGDVLHRLRASAPAFDARVEKTRGRADALYAARRWAQARAAYVDVAAATTGEAQASAQVRVAAADVQAKQYRAAIDRLRPLLGPGPHQAEARLHHALAIRGLGDLDGYVQAVKTLVDGHGQSPYAEEALNGLATWYLLRDEDEAGARIFATMVERFPGGRFGERAAWKAGWWAYRHGDFAAAVTHFETGARHFPRSDYRPAWLYWSGRSKQRLGDAAAASERLMLTAIDYHNSYYGRLALAHLGDARASVPKSVVELPGPRPAAPPSERQIGMLMALGLYDLALAEIQVARRVSGDSPALVATSALAHHRAGRLRLGINAMKRAYPQYMAAGGESLPPEVLRVLFPVDYAQQLEGSARRHGLDPYVILALAAQESTFDAGISSSAGAIGLMQIMPATGRAVARQIGLKGFSARRLTDPEINMTIGTTYFADLMEQFGQAAYALAGYNAGGHRVVKWLAERPNLPLDEWIDDIPFPETQNYVKRILGTAEDYRRLYGGGTRAPQPAAAATAKPAVDAPAATAPARKTVTPRRPATKPAPASRPPARKRPTGAR
jgi:soluble lytic murein transglycosylase